MKPVTKDVRRQLIELLEAWQATHVPATQWTLIAPTDAMLRYLKDGK